MHRGTPRDIGFRAVHGAARTTVDKISDSPMMQTADADFMNNDSRKGVERVQNYGFTSAILPRSKQEGQQAKGGDGVQPEQPKGESAEAITMFMGGQRNHPVAIAIDDRRHRPRGLKPGENAQYDDVHQMYLIRRDGVYMLSLNRKAESDEESEGEETERKVSMRHVEKKKQERPKQQANSAGQAQGQQQEEDFPHEGEEVNAEVRVTKQKIEFFDADQVIAVYNREDKSFTFSNFKKMVMEPEDSLEIVTKEVTINATDKMDVICQAEFNLEGHPLKVNGGGVVIPPFTVL